MRRLCLLCVLATSCYRLGVYPCSSAENCIDGDKHGTCEASGWCSYPDESCAPSGQRYDDLAGDGLAGECVDATDPTTTNETGTDSGESSSSSGPDPTRPCIDLDGDGFGEGDGCTGPDCDDDNPEATDNCLYVGPEGNDSGAGTRDDPWLTFAHAIPQLQPGSSLVLLDGEYTEAFYADCENAVASSGTATRPIFVRSEVERAADLHRGGTSSALRLRGCDFWRFRGLRLTGGDDPATSDGGDTLVVDESSDIEFRRLLVHKNNRYAPSVLVWVHGSSEDVLFEDIEAYEFTGSAFLFDHASRVVVRRAYVHGRDANEDDCDAEGGIECSGYVVGPDEAVNAGDGTLVENLIAEGVTAGVHGTGSSDVSVLGSAVIDSGYGALLNYSFSSMRAGKGFRVENLVALRLSSNAVYVRSAGDVFVRNVTAIGSQAFRSDIDGADPELAPCPEGGCWVDGANLLGIGAPGQAFEFANGQQGVVAFSNAWQSVGYAFYPQEDVEDAEGLWQRSTADVDPAPIGADGCIAFVPDSSPMKHAGEDGKDIGADLRFRYENGTLTGAPLWDPGFPCGAVIEGVNDDPDVSCIGVHERLHIACE